MMQYSTDPRGMRLLLARHGATDWNETGRYQGRTDLPLSERGIGQAVQLGAWLADEHLDVLIHSGSRRTAETLHYALPKSAAITTADSAWREICLLYTSDAADE